MVNDYTNDDKSIKPDPALFFAEPSKTSSWADIAVAIECKLRKKSDQAEAKRQMKRAAEPFFAHQFRLFVWGLSIYSHQPKGKKKVQIPAPSLH